ncbi:GGDEF domain-containing protein [Chitinimonas sp. JJ19]|uniref:GGDEF domain-containing protein n=1 Tax=Chitinimonas sp. JJ19 TaxID=3109352 RepID=UPI003001C561
MLQIDPDLLDKTSPSPYRDAMLHGYRWLRFTPQLEQAFRQFHVDTHMSRLRWAGGMAITLFALFVLIDLTTLPSTIWERTVPIRLGLIIPAFAITLWLSYQQRWRAYLQWAVCLSALLTGLGTVGVIGVALARDYPLPYEGILLVALFIYFIASLQWWHALLINAITLAGFLAMESALQPDTTLQLYHGAFMLTANIVGATGSYFLEYGTRTTFLVNALLHELAEHDGLTGLYNRRAFNTHLERAWRQAQREQRSLVLAMIDVDYFKRYNDYYGHAGGDKVLQLVADTINRHARRPLDIAARYGGEEFVLLWFNPATQELPHMGEQLRNAIAVQALPHMGSELGHLTISLGLAQRAPGSGLTADDLLKAADEALYRAKQAGRNRVVVDIPGTPLDGQRSM